MSWQSSVFNVIFRTQKPGLRKCNFEQAQASMAKTMSRAENASSLPADAVHKLEMIKGVACEWVIADTAKASKRIILYFHGGAFMVGSPPASHRDLAWRLSDAAGIKVLLVDYRLIPAHVFPSQLEEGVAVYQWLLEYNYQAEDIVFAGDSAGGNMTLAVMSKAQQQGLPLPAAGVCLSPWADLTHSGDSVITNKNKDPMLPINILVDAAEVYAEGHDLADPLISPVFADFKGFPPLLIFAGSTEVLLSDAQRIADNAKAKGVEVEYKAWHKQAHAFPVMAQFLPEGKQAVKDIARFINQQLPTS